MHTDLLMSNVKTDLREEFVLNVFLGKTTILI